MSTWGHRRCRAGARNSAFFGTVSAAAGALAVAAALASGCADDAPTVSAADSAGDAPADSATATVAAGAADGPSVTFDTPNNATVAFDAAGTAVVVQVTAADVDFAGGQTLAYFLDGVQVGSASDGADFTFTNVPLGRRQLAAQVLAADSSELANASSRDVIQVRVEGPCADVADCDDGLVCSNASCVAGLCKFGPTAGCCDNALDCAYGWDCVDNACQQCAADADCDDGDSCTTDACGGDGVCLHAEIAGCCAVDADCDDGLFCTADACNSGVCENTPSDDPLCCDSAADCGTGDVCEATFCYKNAKYGIQRCRQGPVSATCCTDDSDCTATGACNVGTCSSSDPGVAGTCTYAPDPAKPGCCVSDLACDDGDPATADACVSNICENVPDPDYCELPDTSAMVINEFFASANIVTDTDREWIELVNTSDALIDLDGWSLELSTGLSHVIGSDFVIGGAPGMQVGPKGHFVVGATLFKSIIGFLPNTRWSGLSLPDPVDAPGFGSFTIVLKDPSGTPVDAVTVEESWDWAEGRSFELTHPNVDNKEGDNWRASGFNTNPLLNRVFGSPFQYGSPRFLNLSAFRGVESASCTAGLTSPGPCSVGLCGLFNNCMPGVAEGCCEADADCDDGDPCTTTSCDLATNTCAPAEPVEGCCVSNAECDDTNPCNIDRCIANVCRHSGNFVPGCCFVDTDCTDFDACTTDACNPDNTCAPSTPVAPVDGQTCCNTVADCPAASPGQTVACDTSTNLCLVSGDPNFCDSVDDACDDGDPCTAGSCDVAATTCVHTPIAGCCVADADCADDGDACTAEACDLGTNTCTASDVPDCCNTGAECDDGDACTADTCVNNACRNDPIAGCCEVAADCDDGDPCTDDACVGNVCTSTAGTACCNDAMTPEELAAACGTDSDGDGLCFTWTCDVDTCVEVQNGTCCEDSTECDDGSVCTVGACQDGLCKFVPNGVDGCCDSAADCQTGESCIDNSCTAYCAPEAVDYRELSVKPCADPTRTNWLGGRYLNENQPGGACRGQNTQALCEQAWHSSGTGEPAACLWDAENQECRGCSQKRQNRDGCTNTCAWPDAGPACVFHPEKEATYTLMPAQFQGCQTITDEATCKTSLHVGVDGDYHGCKWNNGNCYGAGRQGAGLRWNDSEAYANSPSQCSGGDICRGDPTRISFVAVLNQWGQFDGDSCETISDEAECGESYTTAVSGVATSCQWFPGIGCRQCSSGYADCDNTCLDGYMDKCLGAYRKTWTGIEGGDGPDGAVAGCSSLSSDSVACAGAFSTDLDTGDAQACFFDEAAGACAVCDEAAIVSGQCVNVCSHGWAESTCPSLTEAAPVGSCSTFDGDEAGCEGAYEQDLGTSYQCFFSGGLCAPCTAPAASAGLCTNACDPWICGPDSDMSCCSTHDSPGCTDGVIAACVCNADPFCCDNRWDAQCVAAVTELGCGTCTGQDCCSPGPAGGCEDPDVESCVCALHPECCSDGWGDICVAAALETCGGCSAFDDPCADVLAKTPVCLDDPSRTLFATIANPSNACRALTDEATCLAAFHRSGGQFQYASCHWDGAECHGCGLNQENQGVCTNTCGYPPSEPCTLVPELTVRLGSNACSSISDEAQCISSYHIASQGNGSPANCFWNGSSCQGCGPSNAGSGACTNACVPVPICTDAPSLALSTGWNACSNIDDEASCLGSFHVTRGGNGLPASCFWNGDSCKGCGRNNASSGKCTNACGSPPLGEQGGCVGHPDLFEAPNVGGDGCEAIADEATCLTAFGVSKDGPLAACFWFDLKGVCIACGSNAQQELGCDPKCAQPYAWGQCMARDRFMGYGGHRACDANPDEASCAVAYHETGPGHLAPCFWDIGEGRCRGCGPNQSEKNPESCDTPCEASGAICAPAPPAPQ